VRRLRGRSLYLEQKKMSTTLPPSGPDRSGISPDAHDTPPAPWHADPIDGLVHAAVADRPLEEVIQLITLLEQSPAYARTTVDALRAVGVDRSVEDVGRMVVRLASPPRSADSADEAIRSAAESRPVEDVTRLMALLHRPSVESHCAEEAVRTIASRRPVEELVQLIGQLSEGRAATGTPVAGTPSRNPRIGAPLPEEAAAPTPRPATGRDRGTPHYRAARQARERGERDPARTTTLPNWPEWLTAAALVVCGLMHLPLHRDGAPLGVYGFAVGVSALCLVLAVAVLVRGAVPLLVVAVLVPAALATLQLLEGRLHSRALSQALEIGAAPSWAAGLAAVAAALAALTVLLAALAAERTGRHPAPRPPAGADRVID